MNRRMIILLVLVLVSSFGSAQVLAASSNGENRVLYTDFLENYTSFEWSAVYSRKAAEGNLKREKKDGTIPFSIKGKEGTLEGLLVRVPGTEAIAGSHFEGWVDSFTITLEYPGRAFPVLGASHALTSDVQSEEKDPNTKVEEAYMKFNPDAQGEFRLENFKGKILDKTKSGLAKKVSFQYTPGTVQDAPDTAAGGTIPVDLDGFAKRWNFEGFTSYANIESTTFKAFPVKKGKADGQGRVPFTMVSDNKRIKVEVKGLLLDGIVQSVTVRYIPANEQYETTADSSPVSIKRALYALSGSDNNSGLMRYKDLYLTAGQFDHLIYPSMFASAWDLGVGSSEWNPVLEAKLFNGYQITISFTKENDLRVKEYNFKLVEP